MIYGSVTQNESDDPLARETLETLHQHYPGHAWHVFIGGGVLQVKNLSYSEKWGMALHLSEINQDYKARRHSIIKAGGEFLERANLARKKFNGEKATSVEGIPQKHLRTHW